MTFEELESQAIAYLMNELDAKERSEFEARMAADEGVTTLVDELERTMGISILAETPLVEPPADLKERMILAIPEPESGSDESSVAPDSDKSKIVPFPWAMVALGIVGWAAAASLLFVYLGQRDDVDGLKSEKVILLAENENLENKANELLAVANSREERNLELEARIETTLATNESLQSRVEELSGITSTNQQRFQELEAAITSMRSTNETLRTQLEQLTVQLAASDSARANLESAGNLLRQQSVLDKIQIAALSSENDELRYGFAVWDNESDSGIVNVFNMQTLDTLNQDYQCWVISPDQETPIPAGVFQVDNQGRAEFAFAPSVSVSAAGAFAISLEPKGGSLAPTGPIVLSGAL